VFKLIGNKEITLYKDIKLFTKRKDSTKVASCGRATSLSVLPHNQSPLRGRHTLSAYNNKRKKMKAISNANRIEAITLFLEKPNTDLLSKEELISGLQSMAGIKPLYECFRSNIQG
jgi:hypothetical protein